MFSLLLNFCLYLFIFFFDFYRYTQITVLRSLASIHIYNTVYRIKQPYLVSYFCFISKYYWENNNNNLICNINSHDLASRLQSLFNFLNMASLCLLNNFFLVIFLKSFRRFFFFNFLFYSPPKEKLFIWGLVIALSWGLWELVLSVVRMVSKIMLCRS